uniref:Uncharacterized protein n=1 Tax=Rhizophora mucronata TaxID=61149 RepID=A0A2P2QSV6_RHIMU
MLFLFAAKTSYSWRKKFT